MATPKLPKEVFLRWETPTTNDEPFLEVNFTIEECADLAESRIVGRYQLVETFVVDTQVRTRKK